MRRASVGWRYASAVHAWVWWVTFVMLRQKGEGIVRAYREAQKATARLYR